MKTILLMIFLLMGVLTAANFALAGVDVGMQYGENIGLGNSDPRLMAANVVRVALGFLAIIAIIIIIYGGFLWMTAAGNEEKVDRAKKILVSAIIGLAIILSAFGIASFIIDRLMTATGTSTPSGPGGPGPTLPPGGPGDPCNAPGCALIGSSCQTGLTCNILTCTCQSVGGPGDSCDIDGDAGNGCQKGACQAGLFCDDNCICSEGTGIGEPCDADLALADCQATSTMCSNFLTCDPSAPANCTCQAYPVIHWLSPVGGFCADNPNLSCSTNDDCGGSTCDIDTPNGAPGNIITIGGQYFGATAGQVLFSDASGQPSIPGVWPDNPPCDSNWQDDQIIVKIPSGARNGPVRVIRSDTKFDDTNSGQGVKLNDFVVNNIVKPGLCKIDPAAGYLDDAIGYYGVNFLAGQSKFGTYKSSLPGKNNVFATSDTGTARVPAIEPGQTTSFVLNASGLSSNYLRFNKNDEAARGPFITSFEPASGAPGQYVTIYGSGFGFSRGDNTAWFGPVDSKEADYEFPEVCADSVWSDKQIIIKVPDDAVDNNYKLTLMIDGKEIDTTNLSPSLFEVSSTLPLLPSACKISPVMGDVGTPVSLWGEYFDAFDMNSKVRFSKNLDQTNANVTFWEVEEEAAGDLKPYRADTKVPNNAVSGSVRLVKGLPEKIGNGLNFEIGSCLEASDPNKACLPQPICCPAGTYKEGKCADDISKCAIDIPNSVYEWDFNTGIATSTAGNFTSCVEMSKLANVCNPITCPNSAGQCSPFGGGTSEAVADCAYSCNGVGSCANNSCRYNSSLDRCVAAGGVRCAMATTTKDALGNNVESVCADYQGTARRIIYINENMSCPAGWSLGASPSVTEGNLLKIKRNDLTGQGGAVYTLGKNLKPGAVYTFSGWYRVSQALSAFRVELNFNASSTTWSGRNNASTSFLPLTYWSPFSISLTGVNTTADDDNFIRLGLNINSTNQEVYFRDLVLRENNVDTTPWNKTLESIGGWESIGNTAVSKDQSTTAADYGTKLCVKDNSTCVLCNQNFSCIDDKAGDADIGVCAAPGDICPPDSLCENDDKCHKTSEESCECCCRKANSNEDCCAPLTCEGTCGQDKNTDSGTYGSCSGCRIDSDNNGSIDAAEQSASDNACNCANSFGKYCDVDADQNGDGAPEGVCRDCAALDSPSACTAHSASCCVDNIKNDLCSGRRFGTQAGQIYDLVSQNGNAYCGYYQCDQANTVCSSTNPVIKPTSDTVNYYKSRNDCNINCGASLSGFGLSCATATSTPFATTTTCNLKICSSPYACLTAAGQDGEPATDNPESCGVCCCNPAADNCSQLSANLHCEADTTPCSGAGRGLCCGCGENSECDPANSGQIGCGYDACCRARPSVASTAPLDNAGIDANIPPVCTNAEIRVEFNQLMSADSFIGNVIVVGEHGDTCPAGTTYLAAAGQEQPKISLLKRLAYGFKYQLRRVVGKVFGREAMASDGPLINMNYCAIAGTVSGEQQGDRTILKFTPSSLLEASRKYFVIIKGDENMTNSKGVLSYWNIGMNIAPGNFQRVDNSSAAFNRISYPRSFIFSFVTRPDQGGNKGVCAIDRATLSPSSYLFSTTANDANENDNSPTSKSFDTVRDNDKRFIARAVSSDGQILAPMPGYAWNWDWSVKDPSLIGYINPTPFAADADSQLARVISNVTDKRTDLIAKVNLTDTRFFQGNPSPPGSRASSTASVYVFVCSNPWPPIAPNGTWTPWSDAQANCNAFLGTSCFDYNYELYYCRDSGASGMSDDLPTMSGDTTRGANTPGPLKESYFFRETPPDVRNVNLQTFPVPRGGAVEFNWAEVRDPKGLQTVKEYHLYYGLKTGAPYADFKKIAAADAPYQPGKPLYRLENLDKTKTYYFALTAVYNNGEESQYSEEEARQPADTFPPAKPSGLRAQVFGQRIPLAAVAKPDSVKKKIVFSWANNPSWEKVNKEVEFLQIRYGTSPDVYTRTISLSPEDALLAGKEIEATDLATGTTYYMRAFADFRSTRIATQSAEIAIILNEDKEEAAWQDFSYGVDLSQNIYAEWAPNTDDTVKYKLYWGTNHALYGDNMETNSRSATGTNFSIINPQGMYFLTVTAIDDSGNESERSDEIIMIPGQSAYTFKNALTNVSFEDGVLGGVPTNWGVDFCCSGRNKVDIGISNAAAFSGSRSLRFWQAPDVTYPGTCSPELVARAAPSYDAYPSSWVPAFDGSTCTFRTTLDCNSGNPCTASRGGALPWPYSNRVMWGKVIYNVTNLGWQVGEEYLTAFYYKGNLTSATRPILGFNLNWLTYCRGLMNGSCSAWGGNWHVCPANSSRCCYFPLQEDCYPYVAMASIPSGNYNSGPYSGWNLYFQTFTYTDGLSKLYDFNGNKYNEFGMSIGYNNTFGGTEFFIDDLIVATRQ